MGDIHGDISSNFDGFTPDIVSLIPPISGDKDHMDYIDISWAVAKIIGDDPAHPLGSALSAIEKRVEQYEDALYKEYGL